MSHVTGCGMRCGELCGCGMRCVSCVTDCGMRCGEQCDWLWEEM